MSILKLQTIVVAAALVPPVLQIAGLAIRLHSPGVFLIGMVASVLVLMIVNNFARRKRATLRSGVEGVNARTYTLRAENAEMRQRLADLKAYQVLVPVPETDEQRATLRQLVAALAAQRAIVEARTKDTNAAVAELRVTAGIKRVVQTP